MIHSKSTQTKFIYSIIFSLFFISTPHSQTEMIIPGGDWIDTKGKPIVATEGGIIKVDNQFYMWGMDRTANNYAFVAVNLYVSDDLKNWKFVNQILKKSSHSDLNYDAVVERAKILRNPSTGKCVMWMHFEGHNAYKTAEVAYATCDSISGNYTFVSHFRPMNIDSRDINVYLDTDGKGYLICTTIGNQSVSLFELNSSYTGIVREVYRGHASDNMQCEGHAIINTGGYYFWLMSLCTGWDFNDNHYFYASSLEGPWKSGGKISVSTTHTYESQVGFAVTIPGSKKTTFLYTGDRWSVNNFSMTRTVLLPIEVSGTSLKVNWYDQFDIDTKTGEWTPGSKNFIDGTYSITAKHSELALGTKDAAVQQQQFTGANNQLWRIQNIGASHFKITSVASGKTLDVSGDSRKAGAKILQYDWKDSYNQKWHIIDCGDGYHRFISVNTLGKSIEIYNSSRAVGTEAILGNFAYKDNQLFRISHVNSNLSTDKYYMIINRTSGKALDASGSNTSGSIVQNTPEQSAGQIWHLEDQYNGYFTISTTGTGVSIDNNRESLNATKIGFRATNKQFPQQWQIINVEGNYFKIINRYNGKCIDNKDGSLSDGTALIQYTDYASSNTNQQWKFTQVDKVSLMHNTAATVNYETLNTLHEAQTLFDLRGNIIRKNPLRKDSQDKGASIPSGLYIVKNKYNRNAHIRYHLSY